MGWVGLGHTKWTHGQLWSVPSLTRRILPPLWVCCCAPDGQEISIDCCTALCTSKREQCHVYSSRMKLGTERFSTKWWWKGGGGLRRSFHWNVVRIVFACHGRYSARDWGTEYCDDHVCLSVCPFVCLSVCPRASISPELVLKDMHTKEYQFLFCASRCRYASGKVTSPFCRYNTTNASN